MITTGEFPFPLTAQPVPILSAGRGQLGGEVADPAADQEDRCTDDKGGGGDRALHVQQEGRVEGDTGQMDGICPLSAEGEGDYYDNQHTQDDRLADEAPLERVRPLSPAVPEARGPEPAMA
jgi:hypothetical protein